MLNMNSWQDPIHSLEKKEGEISTFSSAGIKFLLKTIKIQDFYKVFFVLNSLI